MSARVYTVITNAPGMGCLTQRMPFASDAEAIDWTEQYVREHHRHGSWGATVHLRDGRSRCVSVTPASGFWAYTTRPYEDMGHVEPVPCVTAEERAHADAILASMDGTDRPVRPTWRGLLVTALIVVLLTALASVTPWGPR